MEEIKTSMQRISEAMNKLSVKAQQIGYIVEVIDDVADKSDVLSLNAALEGIRAGEIGKGFIIVADEMRKLAVDVLGSTKEIRELIKQIQDACSEAVVATKSGVKSTQQGAEMTSSVEKSFEKILELIKKTSDSVKQISVSTHEQRSGTDHIVNNMNEMAEVSEKSVSGVQRVVESLSKLNDLSRALMKRLPANPGLHLGILQIDGHGLQPFWSARFLLKTPGLDRRPQFVSRGTMRLQSLSSPGPDGKTRIHFVKIVWTARAEAAPVRR
jgi:methyl-accepting chemotaxis protein